MSTRTRRSAADLQELARSGAHDLEQAGAEEVMAWAARHFPGSLAVACSMADTVLPHLVSRYVPGVDVLFLDTGYHFAQTLRTRDAVAATLPVTVVNVRPRLSVQEQDRQVGERFYERDPASCCAIRKMEPLAASLQGYEAWMSGVRREESSTRAGTPLVDWDERHGLLKLNPLAAWTSQDLVGYAQQHGVPQNPLMAQGYPSIGCAPCTRRVAPGEDPRSGRWAGSSKTECGIHV